MKKLASLIRALSLISMMIGALALSVVCGPSGQAANPRQAQPDPNDPVVQADRDLVNKKFGAAADEFEKLLRENPTNIPVLLKLSEALEGKGDLDGAIAHARSATQIDPESAASHLCLAHYLDENRDEQGAAMQYTRVLDLSDFPAARKLSYGPLIRLLNKLGDHKKMVLFARQFIKEFPKDSVAHYDLAWVLSIVEPDRINESIKEYRKSIEMNDNLLSARYNLALLLVKSGKNDEAQKWLHEFVSRAKDDPDVPKAEALLAKLKTESTTTKNN